MEIPTPKIATSIWNPSSWWLTMIHAPITRNLEIEPPLEERSSMKVRRFNAQAEEKRFNDHAEEVRFNDDHAEEKRVQ
jgi:hypothetical protein